MNTSLFSKVSIVHTGAPFQVLQKLQGQILWQRNNSIWELINSIKVSRP